MAPPSPLLAVPGLTDDLDRVEQTLEEVVRADDDFLTEVASHLIRAGGKRQRPAFALAAATTGGVPAPLPEPIVRAGVAVELVHLGSLYHDDVMDDAATRRTVESVNARWGNLQAILAGDFLLARASEIAAELGTEPAGLLAASIARLCEGQVRELRDLYNTDRTEEHYTLSIRGKTASLFATACRLGGIVAAVTRDRIDLLTDFGEAYGMAFQIVDDILDVVASEEQLGKPAGNDLVEGVYTLPVLRALRSEAGPELRDLLGGPITGDQRDEARRIVGQSGAIESCILEARAWADRARRVLEPLEGSPAAEALGAMPAWLVDSVPTPV